MRTYFIVFAVLMVLLAATLGAAYIQLGELNIVVALAIAAVKAALIIYYFMHLRESPGVVWIFMGTGFFFVGILFVFSIADYVMRSQ